MRNEEEFVEWTYRKTHFHLRPDESFSCYGSKLSGVCLPTMDKNAIIQACTIFSSLAKEYTDDVRGSLPTRKAVRIIIYNLKQMIIRLRCDTEIEKGIQKDAFLIWAFMIMLDKNYHDLDFDTPYVMVQQDGDPESCVSLTDVYRTRYGIEDCKVAALVYCVHKDQARLTCEAMRVHAGSEITVDDAVVGYKLEMEKAFPFVLGCVVASWVIEEIQLTCDLSMEIDEIEPQHTRRLCRALINFYTPDLYEQCIMNIINFHLRPEDMYAYVNNCPPMRPIGQFYPEETNEFIKAVLTIEVDRALRRGSPQTLKTVFEKDASADKDDAGILDVKDPSLQFSHDVHSVNRDFWPLLSIIVLKACMKHYDNISFELYTDGRVPSDQSRHAWHDMFSRKVYVYDRRNRMYYTGQNVAAKMLSLYPHSQTHKVVFTPSVLEPTAPILQLLSIE